MSASFQPYIINDIQNGRLNAKKAMPQKDINSAGSSTFELSRTVYLNSTLTNPKTTTSTPSVTNKKWMGNRDASQIVNNRRNIAVGKGSTNLQGGPISFTSFREVNTVNDALSRVRGGGAIAPAKKNANRNNNLAPSFAPIQTPKTKSFYGLNNPYLFH